MKRDRISTSLPVNMGEGAVETKTEISGINSTRHLWGKR